MQRRGRSRSPDCFPGTATAGRRGAMRTPPASVLGHALHPCPVSASGGGAHARAPAAADVGGAAGPSRRPRGGAAGAARGPRRLREGTKRAALTAPAGSWSLLAGRSRQPSRRPWSMLGQMPGNKNARRTPRSVAPSPRVTGAVHRAEAVPRPRQQPRGREPEPGHAQCRPGLFPATTYNVLSPLHGAQCGRATTNACATGAQRNGRGHAPTRSDSGLRGGAGQDFCL